MSLLVRRFAEFLNDLQQLERTAARSEAILEAFTRHTPFPAGALYLRDRDANLRLAAKSQQFVAPDILADEPPTEVIAAADRVLVPLRSGRDHLGLLALSGGEYSDEDLEVLRAAAAFVGTLVANQRMSQEMREGDFQLKYRLWELESLYDIGLSIAGTLNIDELADEVLFRMISLINARRAALFLRDGAGFKPYRSFGDVAVSDADLQRLLETEKPVTLENGTVVAVPINGNNQIIAVLAAGDRETRDGGIGAFEANELRLLSLFANQVGIALENARLHREALLKQAMERELELAATIQRDILPKSIPAIEAIEIAALSLPARQVGGDYHAFFERENGVTLLVADVSGKSMPAALLVSALHAAVQLLVREGRELGEVATELNRHIHHWSAENKFITLIVASIDREAETLQYVNAGHNPGYVLINGQLEQLKSHGLPIGMLAQSKYMTQTRPFPAGSTVVLYSDGITEAEDEATAEFGNDRLEALVRTACSPEEMRDRIAAAVREFVGAAPQYDDETLVIARTR
ncbi:MAG TPA: SpoIIE family protein phosphatase [Thermoanaerobaculia bacterium]|nr:SpoIIE family protein phosphatase [Thermoanaerobaculia bacterium]